MRDTFLQNRHQDQFEQEGYVLFSQFLPPAVVEALRQQYFQWDHDLGEGFHATMHSHDISYRKKVHQSMVDRIQPHADKVLKNYRPLVANYTVKEVGEESFFDFHLDWNMVDERKSRSVTIWVALDDTDAYNGNLWILEQSHRLPATYRCGPGLRLMAQDDDLFKHKKLRKRALPMKAGDAIIYDHKLFHGSPPNLSDSVRIGLNYAMAPREIPAMHYLWSGGPGDVQSSPRLPIEAREVEDEFFLSCIINDSGAAKKHTLSLEVIEETLTAYSQEEVNQHILDIDQDRLCEQEYQEVGSLFDQQKMQRGMSWVIKAKNITKTYNVQRTVESACHAIRGLSFEVEHGETIGLLGPNGSGKSTLLKILSGITKPSSGEVQMRGKVASILEVGTGFHPDLTGRENLFLSGKLLGMSTEEIRQHEEEIIEFSGIAPFIDQRVRTYSSGMFMRLAFSIMAFLESDILLLDEVFSVGDASFRQKAEERIRNLKSNRTVILVSHDIGQIASLCDRVFQLDRGQMIHQGSPREVVNHYALSSWLNTSARLHNEDNVDDVASMGVLSKGVWDIEYQGSKVPIEAIYDEKLLQENGCLSLAITSPKSIWSTTRIAFSIAQIGQPPFWATPVDAPPRSSAVERQIGNTTIDLSMLNKGWYSITFSLLDKAKEGGEIVRWPRALSFEIKGDNNQAHEAAKGFSGPIVCPTTWHYNPSE